MHHNELGSTMCLYPGCGEESGNSALMQSLVSLALALVLDKPVLLLVPRGHEISEKLKKVVDDVEFFNEYDIDDCARAAEALLERNMK